jgi:hypothetical protein
MCDWVNVPLPNDHKKKTEKLEKDFYDWVNNRDYERMDFEIDDLEMFVQLIMKINGQNTQIVHHLFVYGENSGVPEAKGLRIAKWRCSTTKKGQSLDCVQKRKDFKTMVYDIANTYIEEEFRRDLDNFLNG